MSENDIVERLRTFDSWEKLIKRHKLVQEAADEIERLRAALREVGTPDRGYEAWRIRVAREALGDE